MAEAKRKDLGAAAAQWESLAAEVLVGIKDWRAQHPRATFTEIEQELDRELSRLRTRLLEDVALASAATDGARASGGGSGGGSGVTCPTCGGVLVARGQATRAVTVTRDQTVTLPRAYAVCSSCGAGVFPPG
jgi:YgiT-type zinc finger domain-containing protein